MHALQCAVLVVLVAVAYWPLRDAGFIWDDDSYVTGNTTLRSLAGLRRIWFEFAPCRNIIRSFIRRFGSNITCGDWRRAAIT